jgi:hypothetical protein
VSPAVATPWPAASSPPQLHDTAANIKRAWSGSVSASASVHAFNALAPPHRDAATHRQWPLGQRVLRARHRRAASEREHLSPVPSRLAAPYARPHPAPSTPLPCSSHVRCHAHPVQPPLGPAPQTHLHPSRHRPPVRHPTRARPSAVRCLAGPVPPPLVAPRTRLGIGTPIQLAAVHLRIDLASRLRCRCTHTRLSSRRPPPHPYARPAGPSPSHSPCHHVTAASPPLPPTTRSLRPLRRPSLPVSHPPHRCALPACPVPPASTLLPHPPPVRCYARQLNPHAHATLLRLLARPHFAYPVARF